MLLWLLPAVVCQAYTLAGREDTLADSIVAQLQQRTAEFEHRVSAYKASMYVKNSVSVPKKNILQKLVPGMFHIRKGERKYIVETFDTLHYAYPDTYDRLTTAQIGTVKEIFEADGRLSEFFHFNIYSHMLMDDKYVSPLSPHATHYYKYELDTVLRYRDEVLYKINYHPKVKSYQLVEGYMLVDVESMLVRVAYFEGKNEMLRFQNRMVMGQPGGEDDLLPVSFDLNTIFRFMGSRVDAHYVAKIHYQDVAAEDDSDEFFAPLPADEHDLSRFHQLENQSQEVNHSLSYFSRQRPTALTGDELDIYNRYINRTFRKNYQIDTLTNDNDFWDQLGDALVTRNRFRVRNVGSFRLSPILDPQKLGYSHRNGVSYSMDLRFTRELTGDRVLRITPRLGYNFKHKKIYWRLRGDFDLWPAKRSSFHFDIGNGNKIYNSQLLQALEERLVAGETDVQNMGYYNDLYAKLTHSWEIFNGFTLDIGLTLHHRTADKSWSRGYDFPSDTEGNESGVYRVYNSFAPRVQISWTPSHDFYMVGKRKVNVDSSGPTFVMDWEHGMSGVLHHSSRYDRFELDMTDDYGLGYERTLFFRFGAGMFLQNRDLYFIDFEHFRRHNLPDGWNDDIGGVFQLLHSYNYNYSNKYLRAHLAYETPFLIMPHQIGLFKYVIRERIYFNTLYTDGLTPYTELGYGIGTHIFDFGLFASFDHLKHRETGIKITFELFNR